MNPFKLGMKGLECSFSIILSQLSSRNSKLVRRNYHWGMGPEPWNYRCIYEIPEINVAILRPTSYMSIGIGKAAIQFVRLRVGQ